MGTSRGGRAPRAGQPAAPAGQGSGGADPLRGPGSVKPPDLADLMPSGSQDLARTVQHDEEFAAEYPNLWTVLSCQRTVKGQPRAAAEIVCKADGAVFTATLTCPEEMLVLGAEFDLPSDLFRALETRLACRPIPWRKAGKHVKRKQLSPGKLGLPNGG